MFLGIIIVLKQIFQLFHYVGHFTFGAVNLVGSLQIPTFFLLSGFCLSLSEFDTFLVFKSESLRTYLVTNRCLTGYGSPSRTWQISDFFLSRLSRLYPMFLFSNLLGLCGWPGPGPVTPLRYVTDNWQTVTCT